MTKLLDYIKQIDGRILQEDTDMRKKKIMAPIDSITEALWNSEDDRWSRNAKHQMNLAQKTSAIETWKDDVIEEGVMGGLKPLSPLNRMMQLAGIPVAEVEEPPSEEPIEEADTKNPAAAVSHTITDMLNKVDSVTDRLSYAKGILLALGDNLSNIVKPEALAPNVFNDIHAFGTSIKTLVTKCDELVNTINGTNKQP
jgi:hypothetical protein